MAKAKITVGGETKICDYREGESILECALRNDVNAPYSCMEGVCTACLAVVKEGDIEYPSDTILDDDEWAAGRALTCQSKIKKGCEQVVVDYDAI